MCQNLRTRPGKGGQTDRRALQRAGSGEAHVPGMALSGRPGGFHCGCSVSTARLSQSSSCLERRAKPPTARPPLKTTVCRAAALAQEGWASGQRPLGAAALMEADMQGFSAPMTAEQSGCLADGTTESVIWVL